MPESVEYKINKSILNYKRGKIIFPSDFSKYGSSTAIRQALKRLENKKLLLRLAHGIYLYPKTHKLLGVLHPSIEEIALAISKRDKARIIPTGVQALNRLGLSTQVPMNLVYLTDGTPRTIKINKSTIKFKKAPPKILAIKSYTNLLIIQALREIEKENLDSDTYEKIIRILQTVDNDLIKYDMKLAPTWISDIMKKVIRD